MKAVALNNDPWTYRAKSGWRIVGLVLVAHAAFVAAFKYGLPDFSPSKSDITIELSAALPRGESGEGVQRHSKQLAEPSPRKIALEDENAIHRAIEKPQAAVSEPVNSSKSAGVESAPMVDADYKAAYLNNPKPPYPPVAFQMRIEGTVTLRVLVLPDGNAGEVLLGRSSGNALLDQSALTTVAKWRFVPAKSQGKEVSQWVSVPITFSLKRR